MSTDIAPSLGAGLPFTQLGRGTSPGFDAIDVRRMATLCYQEGACEALAYKVTQRALGANMSVDIDADAGSFVVQGDQVTGQGRYVVPPHTANISEAITTADATNPRIDQVVLEAFDDTHDSSGLNKSRTRVIAGTASAGATLDNRTGAAALPNGAVRLADVLVGAGVTSILNASIRDRRPWARGALWRGTRGTDFATTSATFADIDATLLKPRLELSGVPLRLTLTSSYATGTANIEHAIDVAQDGTRVLERWVISSTTALNSFTYQAIIVPVAGSHQYAAQARSGSGGVSFTLHGARTILFTAEELVKQNASND